MADEIAERAEQLAVEFIAPLVSGGEVTLQRPFGTGLALRLAEGRRIVDGDILYAVQQQRIHVMRRCLPVDSLEEPRPSEWVLACALNDLLQATNHELSSVVTRARHSDVLATVHETCAHIPAPTTIGEAADRHATFHNVLRIVRQDQDVAWWTGSENFRGQKPTARLLAWPDLRQVKVSKRTVPIWNMCDEAVPLEADAFENALRHWLSCTPLTDLVNAGREALPFAWSQSTLSLVATTSGSNLARRALLSGPFELADCYRALQRATELLAQQQQTPPAAVQIGKAFTELFEPTGARSAG